MRVLERTNARYLDSLGELVELVAVDVSFISLRHILPAAKRWLVPRADLVVLVKPQFEAGKSDVGKGGIIKIPQYRSVSCKKSRKCQVAWPLGLELDAVAHYRQKGQRRILDVASKWGSKLVRY